MKKIIQFLTITLALLVTPNMTLAQLKKNHSRVGNLFNVNELERHKTIKRLKNGNRLDLDKRDENGNSLLHLAAKNGSRTYGNMLMHLGLSPFETNNEGKCPLIIASEEKNSEMIGLIADHANFLAAAYFGDLATIKKALKIGIFVNFKANELDLNGQIFANGITALHLAAEQGHEAIVRLLLAADADVHAQLDERRTTPLHCVCDFDNDSEETKNHENIVQHLLDSGARVSMQDSKGLTPLHKAAARGHEGIVQKMLTARDAATAINAITPSNLTALHCAARFGHTGVVERLLAAGADKTIQNAITGNTALDMAQAAGHEDVVALLE